MVQTNLTFQAKAFLSWLENLFVLIMWIIRVDIVGWGRDQINQPQGFGQEEKGIKQQIANLIHAVRTVMRGMALKYINKQQKR
jgi:hypothetical protein